jgi:predicted transcriptional regulator of viral defense system
MQTPTPLMTESNRNYMTNIDWFQNVLKEMDVIISHTSALEVHELFLGWMHETEINVYAKEKGPYENINYTIIDDFTKLETTTIRGLLCTSINQTFNDMLQNGDYDCQSFTEALANYYFSHDESFNGLTINPDYLAIFNKEAQYAKEYYNVR